jgi:hypothetical protein
MRCVVDAQLPRALANHLLASGHDAIHVKELPSAGDTTDAEIGGHARDDRAGDRAYPLVIGLRIGQLAHGWNDH